MGNAEYMGKQSQHCLEHILYLVAIIMRCLVLVGSVLACVSSAQSTFDTGYGVPAAPVLVTRVSPLPSTNPACFPSFLPSSSTFPGTLRCPPRPTSPRPTTFPGFPPRPTSSLRPHRSRSSHC